MPLSDLNDDDDVHDDHDHDDDGSRVFCDDVSDAYDDHPPRGKRRKW